MRIVTVMLIYLEVIKVKSQETEYLGFMYLFLLLNVNKLVFKLLGFAKVGMRTSILMGK